MTVSIFLAGASRGVGREIARCLVAQDANVKAFVRSETARADLEAIGASVVVGDALDSAVVEQAMTGEPIDAVISTIGGKPTDGERPDFKGNKNLIDAAVKAGVRKFILVTSIGAGNSAPALPLQVMETLGPVLAEKEQAENHLMASGLTYIVIRPGGLRSEPPKGEGVLTEDPLIAGSIHRADVADLVCRCLNSEQADNKVLSAVGRTTVFGNSSFEEFKLD